MMMMIGLKGSWQRKASSVVLVQTWASGPVASIHKGTTSAWYVLPETTQTPTPVSVSETRAARGDGKHEHPGHAPRREHGGGAARLSRVISGYSLHREHGFFVTSANFAVGGYDWRIQVFPGGACDLDYYRDYVGVFLDLCSSHMDTLVRATFKLSLVDVTGSSPPHAMTRTYEFGSGPTSSSGDWAFMKKSELEASPYLRDDRLTFECAITIVEDGKPFVEVPPSDITDHLGKLLRGGEGADVLFEVQGEAFPAHKMVLAMRSPVFKAQLCGAMREKDMSCVAIKDMHPAVFEALLHFIYTDSLPAMDHIGRDAYRDFVSHLLVAADRYAMERLKIMCESILCKNIDVKTVPTMVALADRHHCGRLDDACIRFVANLDTRAMDDVMTSQGYVKLKATCPLALVELLEKASRLAKSKSSVHIGSFVHTYY